MPTPITPVVKGLEKFELVFGGAGANQPRFDEMHALVSRDAETRVMSRWTFSEEERRLIAEGADIMVSQFVYNSLLQPTQIEVNADEPDKDFISHMFNLNPEQHPGSGIIQ